MAVLTRHRWPGNVRELENVVYRSAVIAQGDAILVKDLPAEIRSAAGAIGSESTPPMPVPAGAESPAPTAPESVSTAPQTLDSALDFIFERLRAGDGPLLSQLERELAARALRAEGGDEAKAAKLLGITKAALQKLRASE